MEQNDETDTDAHYRLARLLDARQERMLYTYRTHEKAADRLASRDRMRRWTSLILTAITAGTLLTSVVGALTNTFWTTIVVSVAAFLATFVSFLSDYFDFPGECKKHHDIAVKLRNVHNRYESLICDFETNQITLGEAQQSRDKMQLEEITLLTDAPRTTRCDYKKASKSIEKDEKPTSSQKEIDSHTPGRNVTNDTEKRKLFKWFSRK